MDSSVSPKDKIWFLCVCHHISNAVYCKVWHDLNAVFYHCCLAVCSFDRVLLFLFLETREHSRCRGWATDWTVRCSSPGWTEKFPSFPKRADRLWGSPIPLFSGYQCSSLGLKCPGREFGRSLASNAELRMSGYVLLLYALKAWTGTPLPLPVPVTDKPTPWSPCTPLGV